MKQHVLQSAKVSLYKHGESVCGDYSVGNVMENEPFVLSDGMGSGIKANILATLTSQILYTMARHKRPLPECVETIASTLPICRERHMAYATFSLVTIAEDFTVNLLQYDNPFALWLHEGKSVDYFKKSVFVCGKEIFESQFKLQEGDMLILMTDGVTNAGMGKTMPDGFGPEGVAEFVEKWYREDMSAKQMATLLASVCRDLCLGSPDDDISVVVLKVCAACPLHVVIGPPQNSALDDMFFRRFFSQEGNKILCGGTTAKAAARYLQKSITYDEPIGDIPAIGHLAGVDLVTEGAVTLHGTVELGKKFCGEEPLLWDFASQQDGISCLGRWLFEKATHIYLWVGQAFNPAHEKDAPGNFEQKMQDISCLQNQLLSCGKKVYMERI